MTIATVFNDYKTEQESKIEIAREKAESAVKEVARQENFLQAQKKSPVQEANPDVAGDEVNTDVVTSKTVSVAKRTVIRRNKSLTALEDE